MAGNIQRTIGSSAELAAALDHASALASINRPVLIMGERGTGKELIAERLHFLSPRWDQAFIAFNCAAVSEELMESELFGHEPGAFTGASKVHHGRFERASGGSLFLDELGTMSSRLQEKLLRVLEYGEFERLGGQKTLKVDVRIIAATNADLKSMAVNNQFRSDLLDRLAFDVINVPALRERRSDIPELAEYFAIRMSIELGWSYFPGFSQHAMGQLLSYDWPGNVRELKNAIERSVFRYGNAFSELLLAQDKPLHQELDELDNIIINPFKESMVEQHNSKGNPIESNTSTNHQLLLEATLEKQQYIEEEPQSNLKEALFQLERRLLLTALKKNHNHQKRAADALGLSYDQIRGLIKKHLK